MLHFSNLDPPFATIRCKCWDISTALTSKFFQVLNPWMPMTYAVSGFREVISLDRKIGQETTLLLVLSSVLVILIGLTGYKKVQKFYDFAFFI